MEKMFEKVDSVILFNFHSYWKNPLINKYLENALQSFEGILIIQKKGKPIFISHPFNFEQAKKQFSKNAKVIKLNTGKMFEQQLKNNCGKRIGYQSNFTTISQLKMLKNIMKNKKFIDVREEIEKEREIKTKKEIENISKAVKETKKVIERAKQKLKKGISEKEVANFVENEFEKDGFETAFCIIAFGENTKQLHHVPEKRKLKIEEEILFDIGAKYKGYCADISESFWFGKKDGKKYLEYEKELEKVKKALKSVEKKLNANVKASDLWKACDLKMPHSLGHGIGLEEHDFPTGIGEKSKWKLKEGMVLAIEPGQYKKFGIRIERDYLITKTGFKEL